MPTATRPLTDAQWICLQPYLHACPSLIRGPCRLQLSFYGSGGLDSPCEHPLAPVAGQVWEVELGFAGMLLGATGASGRAECNPCRMTRIFPPCCWTAQLCAHT